MRSRLRRVLYVIVLDPSRKFGSAEEQIQFLARAFRDRGGLFLPLFSSAPSERVAADYRANGIDVAFLQLQPIRLHTLFQLAGLIRKHQIEVVHWNFCLALNNPYLWGLSVLTPWVAHYYSDRISRTQPSAPPRPWWKWLIKKVMLKRYARVMCVSQFVVDCLKQQTVWPSATACLHFINTDRFSPNPSVREATRRQMGVEQEFVLLAVAYLIKEKGIDVVLRALPMLPERVQLWVTGEGSELAALEQLSRDLNVAERVRFLKLQRNVEPYMQAADALVCPSLWAEAAGFVNIEAQACGLPVLASRIGGIPEYVEEGQTGFLFPPGDHARLAELIRRLLDEPDLHNRLRRQARDWTVERFSPQARLDDFLDLYRKGSGSP